MVDLFEMSEIMYNFSYGFHYFHKTIIRITEIAKKNQNGRKNQDGSQKEISSET
jgi:hypothetical protein